MTFQEFFHHYLYDLEIISETKGEYILEGALEKVSIIKLNDYNTDCFSIMDYLHNPHGPAYIRKFHHPDDGEYWINGSLLTKEQWEMDRIPYLFNDQLEKLLKL